MDRVSHRISEIGEKAGVVVHKDAKTGQVKYASAHDFRRAFGERWARLVMPSDLMVLMRHESIRYDDALLRRAKRGSNHRGSVGSLSEGSAVGRPPGNAAT